MAAVGAWASDGGGLCRSGSLWILKGCGNHGEGRRAVAWWAHMQRLSPPEGLSCLWRCLGSQQDGRRQLRGWNISLEPQEETDPITPAGLKH